MFTFDSLLVQYSIFSDGLAITLYSGKGISFFLSRFVSLNIPSAVLSKSTYFKSRSPARQYIYCPRVIVFVIFQQRLASLYNGDRHQVGLNDTQVYIERHLGGQITLAIVETVVTIINRGSSAFFKFLPHSRQSSHLISRYKKTSQISFTIFKVFKRFEKHLQRFVTKPIEIYRAPDNEIVSLFKPVKRVVLFVLSTHQFFLSKK